MALSAALLLFTPGMPAADKSTTVSLANLKQMERDLLSQALPDGEDEGSNKYQEHIMHKAGNLRSRGGNAMVPEKFPSDVAEKVSKVDQLISNQIRLLDRPEAEYTAGCMAAWKPFNDARCWCYTGCALDCTHEPDAADGEPGVPGSAIHPLWCRESKKATYDDCKPLTLAVESTCANESGDPEKYTPGIGLLASTAGYETDVCAAEAIAARSSHPGTCTEHVGVQVHMTHGNYATEMSFKIVEVNDPHCVVVEGNYEHTAGNSQTVYLPAGSYTIDCMDSYGDGFNGGSLVVNGVTYCGPGVFGNLGEEFTYPGGDLMTVPFAVSC